MALVISGLVTGCTSQSKAHHPLADRRPEVTAAELSNLLLRDRPAPLGATLSPPAATLSERHQALRARAGAIAFDVPARWAEHVDEKWLLPDQGIVGADLYATTDRDKFFSTWDTPGAGVWATRVIGEAVARNNFSQLRLSEVFEAVSPRQALADNCGQPHATTIAAGHADRFSRSLGRFVQYGTVDEYTGCPGSTFYDYALLTKGNTFVYGQFVVVSRADDIALGRVLASLKIVDRLIPVVNDKADHIKPVVKSQTGDSGSASGTTKARLDKLASLFPTKLGDFRTLTPPLVEESYDDARTTYASNGRGELDVYMNLYSSPTAAKAYVERSIQANEDQLSLLQHGVLTINGSKETWYLATSNVVTTETFLAWTNGAVLIEVSTEGANNRLSALLKEFYAGFPY